MSTVAADDDIDKRGVSDHPIRGAAMIAIQEGGRSRPDHLSDAEVGGGKRRRPFAQTEAGIALQPKALEAAPDLRDRCAPGCQKKRDEGGQHAPCLLSPLLAPLVDP